MLYTALGTATAVFSVVSAALLRPRAVFDGTPIANNARTPALRWSHAQYLETLRAAFVRLAAADARSQPAPDAYSHVLTSLQAEAASQMDRAIGCQG
jgi:hypothetical protein